MSRRLTRIGRYLGFFLSLMGPHSMQSLAAEISYGGRLSDSQGAPLRGPIELTLRFYDEASGGMLLHSTQLTNVPLVDGIFQVTVPFSADQMDLVLGDGSQALYIEVESQGKVYPRQRLNFVPLALRVPVDTSKLEYDRDGRLTLASGLAGGSSSPVGNAGGDLSGTYPNPTLAASGVSPGNYVKVTVDAKGRVLSGQTSISGADIASDANIADSKLATITTPGKVAGSAISGPITGTLNGVATNISGTLAIANGGTGAQSASQAFDGLSPLTTPGDILIAGANGVDNRLGGNTTATKKFLSSTGNGSQASLPEWDVISASDITSGTLSVSRGGTGATTAVSARSNLGAAASGANTDITSLTGLSFLSTTGNVGIGSSAPSVKLDVVGGGRFAAPNALELAPYGSLTGNTSELRFDALFGSGSNYVGFRAPDLITSSRIWTLPASDGAAGQVLTTNGAGILSWGTVSGGGGGGGTVTSVNLAPPSAGITVSGGPIINSGSISIGLSNDLAAVEGLTGTGGVERTGTDTWGTYTLTAQGKSLIAGVDAGAQRGILGLGSLATSNAVSGGSGGTITDGTITNDDIAASAAIAQSKVAGLTTDLAAKEGTITGGTTSQYYRGDKSWQTLNTTAVTEGTNLYFTSTRARQASSATAPLAYDTATGVMSMGQASTVASGFLSSTDFTAFSNKQSAITSTSVINAGTVTTALQNGMELKPYGGVAGNTGELRFDELASNGPNFVGFKAPDALAANVIWTLPSALGTSGQVLSVGASGVLSWTTPPSAPVTSVAGRTGAVTLASSDISGLGSLATANAVGGGSGGTITDGTITNDDISASAAIAQSKVAGLTTDLAAKEGTITGGTTAQYYRGDKSWQTLNTSAVSEGTNLYFTDTRARQASSATAPLAYDTSTGVMSMGQASTVADGFLSSTDFTAFNNKQSAITSASVINAGTVTSALQNGLELKPYGGVAGNTGELRFDELASNGPNFVGFKAPDNLLSDKIWTLPTGDGSAGQVLTTNGAGILSWATVSGGGGGGGTVTSVNLSPPSAGITVSGGPIINSGSMSIGLSNDLAAVEGLTGTGGVERTGADTWGTYTLTAQGKSLIAGVDAGAQRGILGLGSLATANAVSGGSGGIITDGTITNDDISASAAIAQSKVAGLTTDLAAKEGTITAGTTAQYYRGDKSWQTLNTSAVSEGTNLYFTNTRARQASSATAPLAYDTATGVMSMGQVSAVADGFLSSTDFTAFNNKQSAITSASVINAGTVTSALQNGMELKPYGGVAGNTGELRFDELSSNGPNFVGFKAPDALAGDVIWTLPGVMGTSGQVLSVGASGVLSWTTPPSAPVTTVAGRTGAVMLASGDISGLGSLSTVNAVSGGTGGTISDGTITNDDISASAAIAQSKVAGLTTDLAAKEGAITAGTTAQYYRGDKSWQTLNTSAVTEGSGLYFTNARARQASSALAPLVYDTASGVMSMGQASTVANGFLSSADFNAFNNKQSAITSASVINAGTVTTALQNGMELKPYGGVAGNTGELRFDELASNGTNFVGFKAPDALAGDVIWTLPGVMGTSGQVLSVGASGVLSWTTPPLAPVTTVAGRTGAVTLASGDISGLGSLATANAVGGGTAGTITDGTITNDDISASAAIAQSKVAGLTTDLAAKEGTITAGNTAQYYRGDKSWQTLNTTAVSEGTNLYFTSTRARQASSATAPLAYDTATGVMSMGQASTVANGFLSSSDFTAFNNKQSAITSASVINAGTVTSALQNGLELKPFGGAPGNTGELRFDELSSNGPNFVGFKAPDALAANVIWTLPSVVGTSGQVLSVGASGVLTWTTPPSASVTTVAGRSGAVTLSNSDISGLGSLSTVNAVSGGTGGTITDGTITNADIDASAGIVDTKLATIASAGKVANSATTATSANTANAIVARDPSGNFSAGTITANLNGSALNVTGTVALTNGGTGATSASAARTNLGLGSAATLNVGTAASNIVQLDGTAKLPAVDGSQLTGVVKSAGDTMTGTLNLPVNGLVAGTNQFVLSGGNIGIGITGPGSRLQVNGGAAVGYSSPTTAPTNGLLVNGNVGIGTTAQGAMLSVGSNSQFQISSEGNLIRVNNITYNWPASQGTVQSILTNDGSGNLSWVTPSGIQTKSSDFSIASGDRGVVFIVTGAATATLPLISSVSDGFFVTIKRFGTNNISITPASGNTIESATSLSIASNLGYVTLVGSGTSWLITGHSGIVNKTIPLESFSGGFRFSGGFYGKSCKEYLSSPGYANQGTGMYWIDPDEADTRFSPTLVYCDMTTDGGGWTLVVRISASSNGHVNSAAVGTLMSPTQGSVAKLSDDLINAISASGIERVIRFTCNGFTEFLSNYDNNWCSGCVDCANYHGTGWLSYSDFVNNTGFLAGSCGSDEGGGLWPHGSNMNYHSDAAGNNGCYQSGNNKAGVVYVR